MACLLPATDRLLSMCGTVRRNQALQTAVRYSQLRCRGKETELNFLNCKGQAEPLLTRHLCLACFEPLLRRSVKAACYGVSSTLIHTGNLTCFAFHEFKHRREGGNEPGNLPLRRAALAGLLTGSAASFR